MVAITVQDVVALAEKAKCNIRSHYDENGNTPSELLALCQAAIKWNCEHNLK